MYEDIVLASHQRLAWGDENTLRAEEYAHGLQYHGWARALARAFSITSRVAMRSSSL